MKKEALSQKLAFKERSPCKILYLREFKDSSFYMAIMAKFVEKILFSYVTVATVIRNVQSNERNSCGGMGILGIDWYFQRIIFILVYFTSEMSGSHFFLVNMYSHVMVI